MSQRHNTKSSVVATRLGGQTSLETGDASVEYEPRQSQVYLCQFGHESTLVFHADAEVPADWECQVCRTGARLKRLGAPAGEEGEEPTGKTHMDHVRERRTEAELEALLAEAQSNFRRYGKAF